MKLVGRLVHIDGSPVEGVEVEAVVGGNRRMFTVSDDQGRFELVLSPGEVVDVLIDGKRVSRFFVEPDVEIRSVLDCFGRYFDRKE